MALLTAAGSVACSLLVSTDGLDEGGAADAGARDVQNADGATVDGEVPDGATTDGSPPVDQTAACALGATTPNLVLYYQFEEATGATVHDCSATKADGALLGGNDAAKVSVSGKSGKGFTFNGATTCIAAPAAAALALTGAFTLSAWVSVKEFPTTNSVRAIAAKTTMTTTEGWRFGSDLGAVMSFKLGVPVGTFFNVDCSIQPAATWRHFAAIFTPSTNGAIFVNGDLNQMENKNIPAAVTPSTAVLTVGCLAGSNFFSGEIDELRIYDRALTAAEVKHLAQ